MKLEKHLKRKNQSRYYASAVKRSKFIDNLVDNYLSTSGLTKKDIQEKLEKQSRCGSVIILDYDQNKVIDEMNVTQSNFCGNTDTCVLCASRNQFKKRIKYIPKIQEISKKTKHAYFLTYTIKNGKNLKERLNHLRDSLKRFRKMGQKRNGYVEGGEYAKVVGGMLGIEAKRGKNSETWHVHGHGMFFTNEPLDYSLYNIDKMDDKTFEIYKKKRRTVEEKQQLVKCAKNIVTYNEKKIAMSKLSLEWYLATGDSINIHVKKLKVDPKTKTIKQSDIAECIKYATKPNSQDPIDFIDISDGFYNRRTLSTYGELYKLGDIEKEDLQNEINDTSAYIGLSYDWDNWGYNFYNEDLEQLYAQIHYDENVKKVMKKAGEELGIYRRERRKILSNKQKYTNVVNILNSARKIYREKVRFLWKGIREHSFIQSHSPG